MESDEERYVQQSVKDRIAQLNQAKAKPILAAKTPANIPETPRDLFRSRENFSGPVAYTRTPNRLPPSTVQDMPARNGIPRDRFAAEEPDFNSELETLPQTNRFAYQYSDDDDDGDLRFAPKPSKPQTYQPKPPETPYKNDHHDSYPGQLNAYDDSYDPSSGFDENRDSFRANDQKYVRKHPQQPPQPQPWVNDRPLMSPDPPSSAMYMNANNAPKFDPENSSMGYMNDDAQNAPPLSGNYNDTGEHYRSYSASEINPPLDGNTTMPRAYARARAGKKDGAFTKLFASLRRNKSQQPQETGDAAKEPVSRSGTLEYAKSKFRSLSRTDLTKIENVQVKMLDGKEESIAVDLNNATGQVLFDRVCDSAGIVENNYFGLTYVSKKYRIWFWLDLDQKINKQLTSKDDLIFHFQVKFYAPEPSILLEDITRYNLVLQLRQDIYSEKLPCSWVTLALLGSFTLQSEIGDYDPEHPMDFMELRSFNFTKNPSDDLLLKIVELHQKNRGMSPSQADLRFLETAKRLDLYGIDLHPARDAEKVQIHIGVGYQGVVIYREHKRISRFAWPKILRISYEKEHFYLTVRPDTADDTHARIGFRLFSYYMARRLWKAAIEHHSFFRLKEVKPMSKAKSAMKRGAFGGSHHQLATGTLYQNRTNTISRPNPQFERTGTKQLTKSLPYGLNDAPSHSSTLDRYAQDAYGGRPYGGKGEHKPQAFNDYGEQEERSVGGYDRQRAEPEFGYRNGYDTDHALPNERVYANDQRAYAHVDQGSVLSNSQSGSIRDRRETSYNNYQPTYRPKMPVYADVGGTGYESANREQRRRANPGIYQQRRPVQQAARDGEDFL